MSIVDDFSTATSEAIDAAKEQTTWAGTIITANPLTVQLDGSGVPVDCLAADFVSVVAQRRCVVQKVGAQLVVMATFGGAQLNDLAVSNQITVTPYTTLVSGYSNTLLTSTSFAPFDTVAGLVFTTPPSGKISVYFNGRVYNNSPIAGINPLMVSSYEIRTGGVLGSGTVVIAASGNRGLTVRMIPERYTIIGAGRADVYTLTPNTTFNIQPVGYSEQSTPDPRADLTQITIIPLMY